jgi:hypothetical protein
LKIPITHKERAGRVAQGEGPEFKLQYCKKKKINTLFLREKPKSFIIEDDVNFSMMPFSV